jgi:hypothetical protein
MNSLAIQDVKLLEYLKRDYTSEAGGKQSSTRVEWPEVIEFSPCQPMLSIRNILIIFIDNDLSDKIVTIIRTNQSNSYLNHLTEIHILIEQIRPAIALTLYTNPSRTTFITQLRGGNVWLASSIF